MRTRWFRQSISTRFKPLSFFLWTILIIAIGAFWITAYELAFNFPYYDDLYTIVRFIHQYRAGHGTLATLALLSEQNFDHRVLICKVVTLLQYVLTGQISIRWLILLGDLSLLCIAGLFYHYYRNKQLSLPGLTAVCCMLFQVQHYEDTISWATCSLQHAPCIALCLWSFHMALTRQDLYFSGFLASLGILASANGIVAVPIWLLIVGARYECRGGAIIPALMLITVGMLHLATFTVESGPVFLHAASNMRPKLILLFSFAGQVADSDLIGIQWSVILGILVLLPVAIVLFAGVTRRMIHLSNLQWVCVAGILSVLFVGFLICFARGTEPDPVGYKMDRYKIYAALFVALAVAFYDRYWSDSLPARLLITATTVVFCGATYYIYYGDIRYYRDMIEANQYSFTWSKRICEPYVYDEALAGNCLSNAQATYLANSLPASRSLLLRADWKQPVDTVVANCVEHRDRFEIRNGTFRQEFIFDQLYVAALDADSLLPRYLVKVKNGYYPAVRLFYTTFSRPAADGFTCSIAKTSLKPGQYELRLVAIKKGREAQIYKLFKIKV